MYGRTFNAPQGLGAVTELVSWARLLADIYETAGSADNMLVAQAVEVSRLLIWAPNEVLVHSARRWAAGLLTTLPGFTLRAAEGRYMTRHPMYGWDIMRALGRHVAVVSCVFPGYVDQVFLETQSLASDTAARELCCTINNVSTARR